MAKNAEAKAEVKVPEVIDNIEALQAKIQRLLQILNLYKSWASAVFSVQRPGQRLGRRNLQPGRSEAIHGIGIYVTIQQRNHNIVQLHRIPRALDQCHFKYTVIKPHILSYDAFESANRTGIRHHSKDEIAFPAAFL